MDLRDEFDLPAVLVLAGRNLAAHYAKRASLYRAGLVLIATIIWLS
ncbi:hypothetical protein [Plantactinospora endophytica]|uniref:Uncharacterized protein n=1 Tax=Plantactinospora endophytica TaxID=673535 RepID=A0ABQ4EEU5_9ACTN|nr:hypothetical protein [Plantactinospora endophytica]GIG93250.1 hypothetical protein Pen02_81860 [Plantactinospora endophytica]